MSEGTALGRPRSSVDMMIAAIAEANDCVIVTDNEKDFAGTQFINPIRANLKTLQKDKLKFLPKARNIEYIAT